MSKRCAETVRKRSAIETGETCPDGRPDPYADRSILDEAPLAWLFQHPLGKYARTNFRLSKICRAAWRFVNAHVVHCQTTKNKSRDPGTRPQGITCPHVIDPRLLSPSPLGCHPLPPQRDVMPDTHACQPYQLHLRFWCNKQIWHMSSGGGLA